MKKKNLLILLIIPFLISTLTIVTVNVTYNYVDVDISYIEWKFNDIEAFQVSDTPYALVAKGVNQRHTDVGKGNELTWRVRNRDGSDNAYAEIIERNGYYYLKALSNGEVEVICSNSKGNVSRSFFCIVYTDGAIIISSTLAASAYGKIDPTEYFGQYDFDENGGKQAANFDIQVRLIPEALKNANPVLEITDNISVNLSFDDGVNDGGIYTVNGKVSVIGAGESSISVKTDVDSEVQGGNYKFTVVEDGVNVYTYEDLLNCTNRSQEGEITVLHKSFESYATYSGSNNRSTLCFGYQSGDGLFNFNVNNGTVCKIPTKYNHEYLDQWNMQNPDKYVDPSVYVGLKVQKDFYGNGYSVNFHNLAYPSDHAEINGVDTPLLATNDLFRGPLPFYTVGDPSMDNINTTGRVVSAYGQDNVGLFVTGDGITVNDVVVKNCDDVNTFTFLNTVGTVVEADGSDITLKNMRMSNGKNILRSFSSPNLLVDNCMLSNARNFLFETGANEYEKPDEEKIHLFTTPYGSASDRIENLFASNALVSYTSNDYISGLIGPSYTYKTKDDIQKDLLQIQDMLSVDLSGQYKGSTTLNNCLFYRSGIASVAFESLFNGSFLYDSKSSMIGSLLSMFTGGSSDSDIRNIGGTSYPVSVNVQGSTKFYDYKTMANLDLSGLIEENISTVINELNLDSFLGGSGVKNYTIDDIFPIKNLLKSGAVYSVVDGESYVNIPFAYYGGGKNYSRLTFNGWNEEDAKHINGRFAADGTLEENTVRKINLLDSYLNLPPATRSFDLGDIKIQANSGSLIKTVTIVTGYEPFRFVFNKGDGESYLFGKSPQIEEMQAVANAALMEAQNA